MSEALIQSIYRDQERRRIVIDHRNPRTKTQRLQNEPSSRRRSAEPVVFTEGLDAATADNELRLAVQRAVDATIRWNREHRADAGDETGKVLRSRPAFVIQAPAGLGKTTKLLAELEHRMAGNPRLRFFMMVPTVALAVEVEEKARAIGIENVHVLRGRGQPQPDNNSLTMCQKAKIAEKVSSLGMSVKPTLCNTPPYNGGEEMFCPFYEGCAYRSQFEGFKDEPRGGLYIGSHAWLSIREAQETLNAEHIDLLIVDESFCTNLGITYEVEKAELFELRTFNFQVERGDKDQFEFFDDQETKNKQYREIHEACKIVYQKAEIEKRMPKISELRDYEMHQTYRDKNVMVEDQYYPVGTKVLTSENFRHLAYMEMKKIYKPRINAGMDYNDQAEIVFAAAEIVRSARRLAACWRAHAEELEQSLETGLDRFQRIEFDIKTLFVGHRRKTPLLDACPVLYLDAMRWSPETGQVAKRESRP